MKPQDNHHWILITRILSGEADKAEEAEFQRWLKRDLGNQRFFDELEACWQEEPHRDAVDPALLFDYESGLHKLRGKLDRDKRKKAIQSNNYVVSCGRFLGWKVAASILLALVAVSVFAVMHFWTPPVKSYTTSTVEQRIINLPDGSTVRLNKNSKISFAKGFSGSTREITLSGEAFFHVKHRVNEPFIIHVGNAVIRDIGTSFNVNEGESGQIVVAVKNGMVSVRNDDMNKGEATILRKNQVGVLKKGHIAKIKTGRIQNYLSWISGQIVFKKVPFYQIIRQLDNIYGVHCQLADSSLSELELTAYIKNTSLHDVLHMIALSLDIKYQKRGNKIVWMQESKNGLQVQPEK